MPLDLQSVSYLSTCHFEKPKANPPRLQVQYLRVTILVWKRQPSQQSLIFRTHVYKSPGKDSVHPSTVEAETGKALGIC